MSYRPSPNQGYKYKIVLGMWRLAWIGGNAGEGTGMVRNSGCPGQLEPRGSGHNTEKLVIKAN